MVSDSLPPLGDRRPIAARSHQLTQAAAQGLLRMGLTPDAVSLLSILWAVAAAGCFFYGLQMEFWQRSLLLLAAAVAIVARLLCNLFDGMMAVEGRRGGPLGALYNELPDRLSDSIIFLGLGYGLKELPWAVDVAWAATVVALLTAYVRAMGASLGRGDCFHGPMAKPHRMWLLVVLCVVTAALPQSDLVWWAFYGALVLIIVGGLVTCWRRLRFIATHLRQEAQS